MTRQNLVKHRRFGMAIEDIKNELERRFAEPLDEFYKRRIIFWNDEEGEFLEEVKDLELSNASVLILEEGKLFIYKKLLSYDDLENNYLVYNPFIVDSENDWFLDLKLYNEEFRADLLSRWMDEMHILNTPELRKEVKTYKSFFNAKARRDLVACFDGIENRSTLYLSILAAACKSKERSPEAIIKAVIASGPDEQNEAKLVLLKYSISDLFWKLCEKCTGYKGTNIDELTNYILFSALSRNMSSELLTDFSYSDIHSGFSYDLVFHWMHSEEKREFFDITNYVSHRLNLHQHFASFNLSSFIQSDVFPILDEIIITQLISAILQQNIDVDTLLNTIEKRRTSVWYEDYAPYYDGIYQVALMKQFEEKNRQSFHHSLASEMFDAYTSNYYQMDTMYREFYQAFSISLQSFHSLDDLFKDLANYVEKEYKNWFLDKLSSNWNRVIEKDLAEFGQIQGIRQQVNFYQDEVQSMEGKVFVIISDAMRYDVAYSLAKQLEIETNSDVEITAQQGIFPTITKFGMAALLPHKKLSIEKKKDSLKVLVDGHSSEMSDRDGLLKAQNENSVALKYKDLLTMKRDEKRAATKGKEVVYIYHDLIDASSHNDESTVFDACGKTIQELTNLVRIICNELMGVNILITSDHGFLYTYQALSEMDMMSRSDFKENILEQGRRYVLTDSQAKPDFLMPVKGIYNEADVLGFAPRENIRIRGAGGINFVHGGTSLQELCVPLIKYKFVRSGYKALRVNKDKYETKPVELLLLSSNRKISNMIFHFSFYQKEAVKENRVACTYIIYLIDEMGHEVSDRQKVIADRSSDLPKDREFKCTFNLKSQKFSHKDRYYLVIEDEKGKQAKEEVEIDIAMAIDDFDFFS